MRWKSCPHGHRDKLWEPRDEEGLVFWQQEPLEAARPGWDTGMSQAGTPG